MSVELSYNELIRLDNIARFKVSRNQRGYSQDITEDFLNQGVYEVDVYSDKTSNFISKIRCKQFESVNQAYDNRKICLLFIEGKNKKMYFGKVESKFRKNTNNPFYLTDSVKIKANASALLEELNKLKPASAKGIFIGNISISSTMGPGIKINPGELA